MAGEEKIGLKGEVQVMRELVIAVHPDDETLGAGGTLLRHRQEGSELFWLIVTWPQDLELQQKREKEIEKVAEIYGFVDVFRLDLPTTKLDSIGLDRIIALIHDKVVKVRPDTVYVPWIGDIHSDHRIVAQASAALLKSYRYEFIKKVLVMEVVSETDLGSLCFNGFVPNYFVNIEGYLEKKKEIFSLYQSECSSHPFPRSLVSIESLAILRGKMCNCYYAEGFYCLKCLE